MSARHLPNPPNRFDATRRVLRELSDAPIPFESETEQFREADRSVRETGARLRNCRVATAARAANLAVFARGLEEAVDALGAVLAKPGEHPRVAIRRYGVSGEAFLDHTPGEALRYPWLVGHLIRSIAFATGVDHGGIKAEVEAVIAASERVAAAGRHYRQARADQRNAHARRADAEQDWEIAWLALKRRSRAVPGLYGRLFGGE
jgi:hypothetical protein